MNMEESSKEQQSLDEAVLHEPPEVHLLSLKNSDEGKNVLICFKITISHQIYLWFPQGAFIQDPNWPNLLVINCYLCGQEYDGVENSVDHIRNDHGDSYNADKQFPCAGMSK